MSYRFTVPLSLVMLATAVTAGAQASTEAITKPLSETAAKNGANIVILATGGTIAGAAASDVQAGYTRGEGGGGEPLAPRPPAKKLATMSGGQGANNGA